jgi:acylphosphatase
MSRVTVFVSGRVQGVGFRYSTHDIAKNFAVTGTVENLDDGRVKIVVEGEAADIDLFLAKVKISAPGEVRKMDRFESEATGEFDAFAIKR